jgi:glycosyltransferase involved in cell wall biosynthesis
MIVSVIIPAFRRPESILRAARSVLAQRGVADFEQIAVDNSP